MSTFREAVLHDAGETDWIDVEVVAYPARNPGLLEEVRAKSVVSGRSHSLNAPHTLYLATDDQPGWRRELTRYEQWAVWDVLGGLAAVRRQLEKK